MVVSVPDTAPGTNALGNEANVLVERVMLWVAWGGFGSWKVPEVPGVKPIIKLI